MAYQSKYSGTEIDEAIGKVGGKLDQTGEAGNTTVDFVDATERAELTPKDKLSVLIGKISKWLKGLKNVAFSGSYNDLEDTPDAYALPTATQTTLGGIKVGANLSITADGTLNAEAGGTEGTTDYNALNNQPSINGVKLVGNKTVADLGIAVPTKTSQLTNDSDFTTKAYVDNAVANAGGEISNAADTLIRIDKLKVITQDAYESTELVEGTAYLIIND